MRLTSARQTDIPTVSCHEGSFCILSCRGPSCKASPLKEGEMKHYLFCILFVVLLAAGRGKEVQEEAVEKKIGAPNPGARRKSICRKDR